MYDETCKIIARGAYQMFRVVGFVVVMIGVLLVLVYFHYDTTVKEETGSYHNMGLIAERICGMLFSMSWIMTGGLFMLLGILGTHKKS